MKRKFVERFATKSNGSKDFPRVTGKFYGLKPNGRSNRANIIKINNQISDKINYYVNTGEEILLGDRGTNESAYVAKVSEEALHLYTSSHVCQMKIHYRDRFALGDILTLFLDKNYQDHTFIFALDKEECASLFETEDQKAIVREAYDQFPLLPVSR